jgi:hypothetical protein
LHVLEETSCDLLEADTCRNSGPNGKRRDDQPFGQHRTISCLGDEPTASRTPNSRVRALTENDSTPATTDDGDQQRDAGKSGEHECVQPLGREHFRAHVFQRCCALERLIRGEAVDHPVTAGTIA